MTSGLQNISAPAPRRTQAQRRSATQQALLRATVECLVHYGYAGTTTSQVQNRAGVSRGALSHHYASKTELLLASIDYMYAEFSSSIRAAAAQLPQGRKRVRPAIELIWNHFHGELFQGAMELWGAARTDPELRAALLPHERALGVQLRELTTEVFGHEAAQHPMAEATYFLLMTSMRGQAMTYALQPEAPRTGAHVDYWVDMVEALAQRVSP